MHTKNAMIPGCGYHHVAIRASDFEATRRFYTEGLGFRVAV
jgi:glyoxylase I family protein